MKKFKKIIFLACFVMLIAVMAIAVSAASAYDTTRTVDVDLTKLPGVTTVNGKIVSGDSVKLPLYKDNGDGKFDALTWYVDSTGTNLVSIETRRTMHINNIYSGYEVLGFYKVGAINKIGNPDTEIDKTKIVVLNTQDDTIDGWSTKIEWGNIDKGHGITSDFLQYIYFGDSIKLFYSNGTFVDCTNLKGVYFTMNSHLTNTKESTFKGCTSLTEAILPPSLKTVGKYIFSGCSKLEKIILPKSVTTISENAFNGIFEKATFFFTGTAGDLTTLRNKANTGNDIFEGATQKSAKEYAALTEKTGAYAVYGYSICDAYYGGGHTMSATSVLAYANGFDKEGTSTCTCTRDECGYSESTTIDPIFVALGYSIKDTSAESTSNAIYAGFTVNKAALDNYNAYITAQGENALKYGIVVVNMGTSVAEGADLAFGANGIVNSDKAIQVEINDANFTRFGFTLTGFGNKTKALNIVISAYVIESETDAETETTTVKNVSFVQQESKDVTEIEGIDSYYTATVKANGSETKKLGTMTLTQLLTLTGKGVVTEDTITNGESSGVTT